MTVAELITLLQRYSPDARVYVAGYEYGIADVDRVLGVGVKRDAHVDESYCGPHEEDKDGEPSVFLDSTNAGRSRRKGVQ